MFQLLISLLSQHFLFFALHFDNKTLFPKPLSAKDERACFERLSEGDKSARDELIEHNLRLVAHIIKKYYGVQTEQDDLVSIGTIGLIKAINTFNPDKKIRLSSYASRCIENEILMYLRKVVKRKCEVSLDEPINVDVEGNELLLSDVVGTEPDQIAKDLERKQEIEQLYKSFSALSKREFEIIKLRYGLLDSEELTQKEIADMMGISQSYISRIEKQVLGKLKKALAKLV